MTENTCWLRTKDGIELFVRSWGKEIKNPKAVIVISHGMTEHIARYGDLAASFNKEGYIVYGDDHRGHGKTGVKQGQLGSIGEKNGFQSLVEDLYLVIQHVREKHAGLPVLIYGHSMGSFITRNFLQTYSDEVSGVILSGTGFFPGRTARIGLELAATQPPRKESALMNKLVFGDYNSKIRDYITPFDWLSRDKEVVESYMEDPLSGYVPTAGFFVDLLTGILSMQDIRKNKTIRKDLPMLFISGEADPVGNYSKGVFKAAKSYRDLGLTNILVTLYQESRHELHNELNKDEVFEFVNRWIKKQLHLP